MVGQLIGIGAALRSLAVLAVLLVVAIALGLALGSGLAVLGLVLWTAIPGAIVAGVVLIVRADRPLAGVGAILTAVAAALAFVYTLPGILWTVLFLAGVALVIVGTASDTLQRSAWPVLLVRVGIGWALVDNAQDHLRNAGWFPDGGGFLRSATGAANRPPTYFLDPIYQGFLREVVVPNGSVWAGFTAGGELAFGLFLALGLFTPVAALGAMFLNFNYMNMKSFVVHSAYTDKVFFLGELFSLVTCAGLVYGLDASLRRVLPVTAAQWLTGAPADESEEAPLPRPEPRPA